MRCKTIWLYIWRNYDKCRHQK